MTISDIIVNRQRMGRTTRRLTCRNTGTSSPANRNTTRAPLLLPRPGRAIRIFRIPPPSATPALGVSATILMTSARSALDSTPFAATRYAGVSTTVCSGAEMGEGHAREAKPERAAWMHHAGAGGDHAPRAPLRWQSTRKARIGAKCPSSPIIASLLSTTPAGRTSSRPALQSPGLPRLRTVPSHGPSRPRRCARICGSAPVVRESSHTRSAPGATLDEPRRSRAIGVIATGPGSDSGRAPDLTLQTLEGMGSGPRKHD